MTVGLAFFQMKISDILLIYVPNIVLGWSLDLSHWGGSNMYPQSDFEQQEEN